MSQINAEAEARSILDGSEEYAHQVENVAKAIFQASVFPLGMLPEGADLRELWNAELATSRIRYRQQARAALAASDLLERVAELERGIREAVEEGAKWGSTPEGHRQARAGVVGRLLEVPGIS